MAPTPFSAILVFQTEEGYGYTQRCTVSDVNGQFYIFQDGNDSLTLPTNTEAIYLVDVQLSGAGTDTSHAVIYANQRETGEQIQNALNLASNLSRQFMSAPIGFLPGTCLRIQQKA